MFTERTSVGLDVHARSVAAAAIDGVTGAVVQSRLTPSFDHIKLWLADRTGPVAVAYEAGPTGFGLARFLTGQGIDCQVAARRSCSARRGIGSRPMCAMPGIWPGCCTWARSWR